MISKPQSLNGLNNKALKQLVIESAPIFQRYFLDGPDQLAHFKWSLLGRVLNKPELLQLLKPDTNERQGETMGIPIYFSKIVFVERIGYGERTSVISLNLVEKELGYQILEEIYRAPVVQATITKEFFGKQKSFDIGYPACKIRNSQTEFKEKLMKLERFEENVAFSYGIKLSTNQFKKLLPYCNALTFEPFRNKEMSMDDEGYIGYRDCVSLDFRGITDDYIPKLELPVSYYYDEQHMWPSERLYKHIITEIFDKTKSLKGRYTQYGGFSLFY